MDLGRPIARHISRRPHESDEAPNLPPVEASGEVRSRPATLTQADVPRRSTAPVARPPA